MHHAPRRRARAARSRSPRLRRAGRIVAALAAAGVLFLGYLAATVPDVRGLAAAPPDETAFMRQSASAAHAEGRPSRRDYRFVPYARIAQTLKRAVLVAEDSGFWDHQGIELDAIRDSLEVSLAKRRIVRGGSTITQQLAKNLYLSPSQDPLRKLRELMITHRLERLLSKRRIFELYLNVSEWGDDTWGAEAASRHYFGKPAARLGASSRRCRQRSRRWCRSPLLRKSRRHLNPVQRQHNRYRKRCLKNLFRHQLWMLDPVTAAVA